jgi:NADP-dependent 3-hydroxy acid dehydrogenase YdfG
MIISVAADRPSSTTAFSTVSAARVKARLGNVSVPMSGEPLHVTAVSPGEVVEQGEVEKSGSSAVASRIGSFS